MSTIYRKAIFESNDNYRNLKSDLEQETAALLLERQRITVAPSTFN